MTDEQLNEIEKLAEAWGRHEHFSDAPPLAKRVLPLVKALREARAERDAAKECIRCDSKFSDYCSVCWDTQDAELREARAALDQVSSDDRMSEAQILATIRHAQAQKDEAIRQRDEAQALLAALKEEHRPADEIRAQLLAEIEAHAETKAEVERLRKLLNPKPKPDLRDTLMRLMREDQRKAIYAQAWQEAILAGNTREQAHSIARAAVEAALKEGDR